MEGCELFGSQIVRFRELWGYTPRQSRENTRVKGSLPSLASVSWWRSHSINNHLLLVMCVPPQGQCLRPRPPPPPPIPPRLWAPRTSLQGGPYWWTVACAPGIGGVYLSVTLRPFPNTSDLHSRSYILLLSPLARTVDQQAARLPTSQLTLNPGHLNLPQPPEVPA